jgi:hypothetical protein
MRFSAQLAPVVWARSTHHISNSSVYPEDVNAIVSVSLACAMAISALAQDSGAQSGPRGLLASPLVVSGIVVDSTGQPIKDVRIEHLTVGMDSVPKTTSQGLFRVETRAPAIVFRKSGYVSRFMRTEQSQQLRIVLETAIPEKELPSCSGHDKYVSLGQGIFAVPRRQTWRKH